MDIETLEQEIRVKNVLLIYDYPYIELADVNNGKIVNVRPLTIRMLKDLLKALLTSEKKKIKEEEKKREESLGMLDRHVLYYNKQNDKITIAWIYDEPTAKLIFQKYEGIFAIPKLLFHVSNNNLKLYALKRGTNTICEAPFPNTSEVGSVCTGKVKVPELMNMFDSIFWWEAFFFNSVFTHMSNDHYEKFDWRKLKNKKKFDESWLKEIKKYKNATDLIQSMLIS